MTPKNWLFDVAVALVALAFAFGQLMLSSAFSAPDELFSQLVGVSRDESQFSLYRSLALVILPVVLRRKFPWPTFVLVFAAFLVMQRDLSAYALAALGPTIVIYTIARERTSKEAVVAATIAILSVFLPQATVESSSLSLILRLQSSAFMIAAVFAGYAVRTYYKYMAEVEQRAAAAEKSRESEAARRVEEERVRIARELHDITAHSLSAVSIQAAAAQQMIDKDPETAKEAIATIRATAKGALEEIRSIVGVLRGNDDPKKDTPAGNTDRIEYVVSYLESAGLEVQFDRSGYDRSHVPAYIDVALFGVVREAVTNIVRHAQAKHVNIVLSEDETSVQLLVEDDGHGISDAADAHAVGSHSQTDSISGYGITGMKERMTLLGGEITTGNREGGGFFVKAIVPLGENRRGGDRG